MYLETQNKWKNKGPLNSDRKKKQTLSLSVLTSPTVLVPLPDAGAHCGRGLSCPSPEPTACPHLGPPHLSPSCQGNAEWGSRGHGFSPGLSQACGAELAPRACLLRALFPFRTHITTPQARPECWQPAPSPEAMPLFWPPPIPAGSLFHPP